MCTEAVPLEQAMQCFLPYSWRERALEFEDLGAHEVEQDVLVNHFIEELFVEISVTLTGREGSRFGLGAAVDGEFRFHGSA